jgi:hypothetical protein
LLDAPTFTVYDVKAGDVGTYEVLVRNPQGRIRSGPMYLTTFTPLVDQTVMEGSHVVFEVTNTVAPEAIPLRYQWLTRGTNIPGATSPRYEISAVKLSDAGEYRLAMMDSSGATNSTRATLVVRRLLFLQPAKIGPIFQVRLGSQPGETYTLEYATALPATNWVKEDLTVATTNTLTLTDSHATNGMRFYRVRSGEE